MMRLRLMGSVGLLTTCVTGIAWAQLFTPGRGGGGGSALSGLTAARIPFAGSSTTLSDTDLNKWIVGTAPAPGSGAVSQILVGGGTRQNVTQNFPSFNDNATVGLQIQSDTSTTNPMLALIAGNYSSTQTAQIRMRTEGGTFSSPTTTPGAGAIVGKIGWEERYNTTTGLYLGSFIQGRAIDSPQSASNLGTVVEMAATPTNSAWPIYSVAATTPYVNVTLGGRGVVLQAADTGVGPSRWVPWFGTTAGVSGQSTDPGGGEFSVVRYGSSSPGYGGHIRLGMAVQSGLPGTLNTYNSVDTNMTVAADGDILGIVSGNGFYGTHYADHTNGASMRFVAVGAWSGSSLGEQIRFQTQPSGSFVAGGRITVVFTDTGGLDVGTTASTTAQFRVSGSGAITTTSSATKGACTLNGSTPSTCTATVSNACTPVCGYKTVPSLSGAISCDVSGTTMTATAFSALTTGTVNYLCL